MHPVDQVNIRSIYVPSGKLELTFVSCRGIVENSEITRVDKTSDIFQEENGGPYKSSIPLLQATSPAADVILAYEMNGKVQTSLLFC